jgi:hypothetical protein
MSIADFHRGRVTGRHLFALLARLRCNSLDHPKQKDGSTEPSMLFSTKNCSNESLAESWFFLIIIRLFSLIVQTKQPGERVDICLAVNTFFCGTTGRGSVNNLIATSLANMLVRRNSELTSRTKEILHRSLSLLFSL